MELGDLLAPGVRSILIKGPPGAGKTTTSLELLKLAGGGAYVSTRVPEKRLSEQYPWLKELGERGRLLEVSPGDVRAKVEDLRLGVAADVVKQVLDAVHIRKVRMVILDSWDAIAKETDPKERLKAEKTMVAAADASESRITFVSEEPSLTTTDFLCDAIVNLWNRELEGRRIREAEWVKLRGKAIPWKSSLFTLVDGRFHLIPTLKVEAIREPKRFEPIPHTENHYSTGSPDLDRFLGGGLRKGSFILLEASKTVGPDWHLPLVSSIQCNFLMNGGCFFALPTVGVTPQMIIDMTRPHVEEGMIEASVRIATHSEPIAHSSVISLRDKSPDEAIEAYWRAVDQIKGDAKRPCFAFIGMDVVELMRGPSHAVKIIPSVMARMITPGDVTLHMVKPGSTITQVLSDACDLHLKLEEVDGCVLLYGKRPPTILYAMTYDFSKGYPQVLLTPIM